jgi:hypothetical protein
MGESGESCGNRAGVIFSYFISWSNRGTKPAVLALASHDAA